MPAYLVEAVTRDYNSWRGTFGYYLFNEELTQCRLIAKSWERTLDGLRASPMNFNGAPVMFAQQMLSLQQDLSCGYGFFGDALGFPGSNGVSLYVARPISAGGDGMDVDM